MIPGCYSVIPWFSPATGRFGVDYRIMTDDGQTCILSVVEPR